MPTIPFFGTVTNGVMCIENKAKMVEYLQSLEGKKIQVTIQKRRRKRSSGKPWEDGDQNGYYWAVIVPIVSDYMGERDINKTHEQLLELFAPRVRKTVLGIERLYMIRSSEMDTVQFKTYCDTIIEKMAEFGVVIPDPNTYVSK